MSYDNYLIAKTMEGLEEVLAKEISALGATHIEIIRRGVKFRGNKELMYRCNYWCRTALRIIKPIAEFQVRDQESLYDGVNKIAWEEYLDTSMTFAVDCITSHPELSHSHYAALKSKDAIVDRFRDREGSRPSINTSAPDLRINIHLSKERCTVSLDSSGSSLHLRGYRKTGGTAPLNEVLASGLILLSGWDVNSDFIDPMCGSGTLLIEAAMLALNLPPGHFRQAFGFEKWKDFDPVIFNEMREEAEDKKQRISFRIKGYDKSPEAMVASRQNIRSASLHKLIQIEKSAFEDIEDQTGPGIIITNPPYGERMEINDIISLYKSFGDKLKHSFEGFTAWVISADLDALKHVGLKPSRKIKLYNGKLECRFVKFELYKGSRRDGKGEF